MIMLFVNYCDENKAPERQEQKVQYPSAERAKRDAATDAVKVSIQVRLFLIAFSAMIFKAIVSTSC